jgi:hypothetical protein
MRGLACVRKNLLPDFRQTIYTTLFMNMFLVIVTSTPGQLIKQCIFDSLREARQYFNQLVRDKSIGRGLVRLIEKRGYAECFLLDTYVLT